MDEKIDVAEEQRLAASYAPETKGPLVDELRPLQELADEWEEASPKILAKLNNLVKEYPSWRKMRGDGSCGFRALLFGLFEVLLGYPTSTPDKERLPCTWLSEKWTTYQIDELFSDWIEAITTLGNELKTVLAGDDKERAHRLLMSAFNDNDGQLELIQFIRAMTSSEMKTHSERYQDSLDLPVDEWTQLNVDVPSAEMDFPSLVASYNAVAKDVGLTVHVIYLDQSVGEEANVHHLEPDKKAEGKDVWMLYRPGHYDLVYKAPIASGG